MKAHQCTFLLFFWMCATALGQEINCDYDAYLEKFEKNYSDEQKQ